MEEVWQFLEQGGTVTIACGFPPQALQLSLATELSVTLLSLHSCCVLSQGSGEILE